jgi:hypothetical protein
VRPKDAPPRPPAAEPEPGPLPPPPEVDYVPLRLPPPPLYVCTTYDGKTRETEFNDPNPRCESYILLHPNPLLLPRDYRRACQWIEDSCLRLPDDEACERWRARRKIAASNAMHATSRTQAFLKSELQRITNIVQEHCS